ncbi:hypothetical protein [Marinoscillum furvescens]|uniref:hypothetical protein n=1 Tax=Marinoscillum furvescens TaxID=1026 RepID=UPI00147565EF|nr:hypothetical protein [Marinoscillum furvescens]
MKIADKGYDGYIYSKVRAYFSTHMTSQQIGSRIAVKSALIGIAIAYLIMSTLIGLDEGITAIFWLAEVDYWPHLLFGAFSLTLMGSIFGRLAATEIIERKKDHSWVGIKYGFLTLITGTLIGSTVGFLQEGLDNIGTPDNPFEDYYFKPLFWVIIFGSIPVLLVGLWFGRTIKKAGKIEKP